MSTNKRVTIADVARAAGVSVGTVSRVLNRREGGIKISDATRTLVLEKAKQLGYTPNPFASALRTQRTGVIGAIVRDISDPFLSMLAREIQRAARAQGIDLLFGHAEYDLGIVGRHLAFMHSHWFDGLFLLGDIPGYQTVISELRRSNTPFVVLACGEQPTFPLVNVDEAEGVTLALDYLRSLGHQRIAFIGNPGHGGIHERLVIFQHYLCEHNLFQSEEYIQPCANTRAAALDRAQYLLNLPHPPSAIFCATDLVALGALSGTLRLGWQVPDQVSIIGFDDIEGTADTYPALTTIRQPVGDMVSQAVNLLMRFIEGLPVEEVERKIIVPPKLIVRQSCASPRQASPSL